MDERDANSSSGSEEPSGILTWFQPGVRYEGYGRAELKDPHGFVAGSTVVDFDDAGTARAQMHGERVGSDEPLPMGAWQLFQQDRPLQGQGSLTLAFGLDSKANDCIELVVQTPDGLFVAKNPIGYSHNHNLVVGEPEQLTLTFQLFNGTFLKSEMKPTYFVENVSYEDHQYIVDEVYDLSAEAIQALGNSVERVTGSMKATDPDDQPDNDADDRKERDVKHEPDDVQKKPDAEKDEEAAAKKRKAMAAAPKVKMVSGAPTNK